MTTKSFKDLVVWQKALQLSLDIYRLTDDFDSSEQYGLTSQMRRCAVSIPSNIAEGSKRGTNKDFRQFLRIASGSAAELETQLFIATELYPKLDFSGIEASLQEVQKMLTVLVRKMK